MDCFPSAQQEAEYPDSDTNVGINNTFGRVFKAVDCSEVILSSEFGKSITASQVGKSIIWTNWGLENLIFRIPVFFKLKGKSKGDLFLIQVICW